MIEFLRSLPLRARRRLRRKLTRSRFPSEAHFVGAVLSGTPFWVADVGAANGLPSHWMPLKNNASCLLFEPHPQSAMALREYFGDWENGKKPRVLEVALSEKGGPRTLHLTHVPTGSSLLPIDLNAPGNAYVPADYFHPISEITIETQKISNALDDAGVEGVHAFKLDVQGAELEILRGLDDNRWQKVLCVELEVGVSGCYVGQPLPAEVETFLRSKDLQWFDVRVARVHLQQENVPYHRQVFGTGDNPPFVAARLHEFDAIYFRRADSLLEARDAASIRCLVVLYGLYRFWAEAYSLVHCAQQQDIFQAEEGEELKQHIVAWHRSLTESQVYASSFAARIFRRGRRFWNSLRDARREQHT